MRSGESGSGIDFHESDEKVADFIHELADPQLLRTASLPSRVVRELRKGQILRLERNIEVLLEKRREFNQKMDAYIENLRSLIESLAAGGNAGEGTATVGGGTRVRCTHCDKERFFEELQVIFARESQETMDAPTECYVSCRGRIKKGVFRCLECGGDSLVIRAAPSSRPPTPHPRDTG